MSSHVDSKVNDKVLICFNNMYVNHGKVKPTRVTVHDYLVMTFYFSEKWKEKVDIIDYMAAMVEDFSTKSKLDDKAPNLSAEEFFAEVTTDDLDTQQAVEYHTFFAKGMFSCKRDRPNTGPKIAALCTRVKNPNHNDWHKLHRLL